MKSSMRQAVRNEAAGFVRRPPAPDLALRIEAFASAGSALAVD